MQNIFKNKFVLIAIGVTLVVLVLVIIFSPKKSSTPTLTPTGSNAPTRPELADLRAEQKQAASAYLQTIAAKLPIYFENFTTSPGIITTINLYRLSDDPSEVIRLEIYGLSYLNSETDPKKNPNVTSYAESYNKAMELLESVNIDPKKLIFIYGDKEYVRTTTQTWIDALKLHP